MPAVFTFYSRSGKKGEKPFLEEAKKRKLMKEIGVKVYACPPFFEIKDLSGKEFFDEILKKRLSAAVIVCGEDFRFGKNRECSVKELKEMCRESDISLIVVPIMMKNGEKISTTKIRALIYKGNIKEAEKLLGRKI